MTQWHEKSFRKASGGILKTRNRCDKKLSWRGGLAAETAVSAGPKMDVFRTRGGGTKRALLSAGEANISEGKKSHKAKIIAVVENNADRQFARRNVMTKGAVIKIELGGTQRYAKVTSKPGQSGSVDAVLLEGYVEKKAGGQEKAEKAAKRKEKAEKAAEEAAQTADSD
ncbi:MAG: 30S ribosomal protein S8e [Candidatus Diapherotrites archaeon]